MMLSKEEFVEREIENMKRDLGLLVSHPSVFATDAEPFGLENQKVLADALRMMQDSGLRTKNLENYCGYGEAGEGEKLVGILAHLDVVPAGEGWNTDPYTMVEKDGVLYGRGVSDDKGGAVASLYALKYLIETGYPFKKRVRLILGCNEETGMKDVEHYLANYPAPLFCFSPDADFPLICGEKGIWHGRMSALTKAENIVSISGGVAPNAVSSLCEAVVKAGGNALQSTEDVEASFDGELWHLTAHGISGHASLPEGTKNAIGVMLQYLLDNAVPSEAEKPFLEAALLIHKATDGSAAGIDAVSEGFTPLTVVSGMIGMEDGVIWQSLDSRYVPSTSGEEILSKLRSDFEGAAEVTCTRDAAPFYKSPECPEIKACMDAYCTVTGEKAEPFTIGGGTYARDFPNAVGFGPEYEGRERPAFVGSMHGAEEGASKTELLQSLKIYILSLLNLEEVDF